MNIVTPRKRQFLQHDEFSQFSLSGGKTTPAFIPAEAHVSQNPILVIIEVDLSGLREEGVGQFTGDAVETVV